uniref:Uncharacterized protein n=1 Tax=Oryza brachyantha TaxID=4533 RepID=J3KYK3_ORYBR
MGTRTTRRIWWQDRRYAVESLSFTQCFAKGFAHAHHLLVVLPTRKGAAAVAIETVGRCEGTHRGKIKLSHCTAVSWPPTAGTAAAAAAEVASIATRSVHVRCALSTYPFRSTE